MIRIEWSGRIPEVRRHFAEVAGRIGNFERLHQSAVNALRNWVRRNYDDRGALLEGFPAGWPPLAPATLASRRRRGRGTAILEDSGKMRARTVLTVDARRALLSNPVPYAVFHQLGEGVPHRPIFPGARQAMAITFPAVVRHVEEMLG